MFVRSCLPPLVQFAGEPVTVFCSPVRRDVTTNFAFCLTGGVQRFIAIMSKMV